MCVGGGCGDRFQDSTTCKHPQTFMHGQYVKLHTNTLTPISIDLPRGGVILLVCVCEQQVFEEISL